MRYNLTGGNGNMKTKDELPDCPVATAVALVGGKWKLLIIRELGKKLLPIMDALADFGNYYKSVTS